MPKFVILFGRFLRFECGFFCRLVPRAVCGRVSAKARIRVKLYGDMSQHKQLIDLLESSLHHLPYALQQLSPAQALLGQSDISRGMETCSFFSS